MIHTGAEDGRRQIKLHETGQQSGSGPGDWSREKSVSKILGTRGSEDSVHPWDTAASYFMVFVGTFLRKTKIKATNTKG